MAAMKDISGTDRDTPQLHTTIKSLPGVAEVANDLGIKEDQIADILPVTEFQRYAVHCAFQKPRREWNYFTMSFKVVPLLKH